MWLVPDNLNTGYVWVHSLTHEIGTLGAAERNARLEIASLLINMASLAQNATGYSKTGKQ